MACVRYNISCPQGAVGGECTFEIQCCADLVGRYTTYTVNENTLGEVCVETDIDPDQEPVIVTSISGSYFATPDPCATYCGDVPAPAPTPAPTQLPHQRLHQLLLELVNVINYYMKIQELRQ